ncbi:MAG: heparin lyase I family protein [Myxococcota bacterium]
MKVIVAHNPDPIQFNGDSAPDAGNPWGENHRNELNTARDIGDETGIFHGQDEERFYGWSTYVPSTSEFEPPSGSEPKWHIVQQFHQEGQCGSPYLALGIDPDPSNNDWRFTLNTIEYYPGPAFNLWTSSSAIARERWYNFVLRVKWATNPYIGRVTLWIDGVQVFDQNRMTLLIFNSLNCPEDGSQSGVMRAYMKMGLYRAKQVEKVETIYQHGMKMGLSYADVDPRGLGEDFELGFPVGWSKASHWRRVTGLTQCGPGPGGSGIMAYNYDLSNGCSYTTWQWFRGQSYSVRSVGELKTKPFAVPSSGGNIQFYHRSQTEQVYGFDVRTVYLDSPTVGRTQIGAMVRTQGPEQAIDSLLRRPRLAGGPGDRFSERSVRVLGEERRLRRLRARQRRRSQ